MGAAEPPGRLEGLPVPTGLSDVAPRLKEREASPLQAPGDRDGPGRLWTPGRKVSAVWIVLRVLKGGSCLVMKVEVAVGGHT